MLSAQKFKNGSDSNGMLGLLVRAFKHFKGLSADIGTLLDQVRQDSLTYHPPLVNNINSARSRVHWNDFDMTLTLITLCFTTDYNFDTPEH